MPEGKLKIIRDAPTKYHFKTKDDQRVSIEHKDRGLALRLYKWGEEASFELVLNMALSDKHQFLENRVEIDTPVAKLRAYPIDTRSTAEFYGDLEDDIQCHEGGLRFELVLKAKPLSNSFIIPIKSKNLRFSYQPFLTEKDIAKGIRCPLNAEGSYAVYHATKKNNQYMTGKAFHLYRPIAEDALSSKAWCALHIDGYLDPKNLTITIPQQFLDEAVYPVMIDPDLGYTSIGSLITGLGIGGKFPYTDRLGSAWTMDAPGGIANYIKAYLKIATNATDVKVFINQKDSGGAGTHGQIATKENLNNPIAWDWVEFTLAGEALTPGVDYILNVDAEAIDSTQLSYDVDGAVASYSTADITYCSEASPWVVDPAGTTFDYSIYCNYTEAAPPPGLENKSANMGSKMMAAGLI